MIATPFAEMITRRSCVSVHYFRSLISLFSMLAGIAVFAADTVPPDNVGFIGDTVLPNAYAGPAFSTPFPDLTGPVADMAVDRAPQQRGRKS
jgi:hypothetical protein